MRLSPIYDAAGRQLFQFGGPQSWRTHQHGEWCVSLEWARRSDGGIGRYLVVWPASQILATPGSHAVGAWVIGSTVAPYFCDFTADDKATGKPSAYMLEQVRETLPMLGRDANDKRAQVSLADAVMRYLPDLALMPAAPPVVREQLAKPEQPTWETQIKQGGRVLSEGVV